MNFKTYYLSEDSVQNLMRPKDSLAENLYRLYEIEYKYSMIKQNYSQIAQRNPRRADRIMDMLAEAASKTAKDIAHRLEPIYEKWLSSHVLTDPKEWARQRMESWDSQDELLRSIRQEILMQKGSSGDTIPFRYLENNLSGISDSRMQSDYPNLFNLGQTIKEEEIDFHREDEEHDLADELEQQEISDFLSNQIQDFGLVEWFNSIDFTFVDGATPEETIIELKALLQFPVWYEQWEEEGIDQTREEVEDAYDSLKEFVSGMWTKETVGEGFFQQMNWIIQITHQTGGLIEDYAERYGGENIDYEYFGRLSNLDPNSEGWNADLQDMGIDVSGSENIEVGYDFVEPRTMR